MPARRRRPAAEQFSTLAADPSGTVYLAFRTPWTAMRRLGAVWTEKVVYFDGKEWNGPITIPQTDAWLDWPRWRCCRRRRANCWHCHHRSSPTEDRRAARKTGRGRSAMTRVNADLYAAEFAFEAPPRRPNWKPLAAEKVRVRRARGEAGAEQVAKHARLSRQAGRRQAAGDARRVSSPHRNLRRRRPRRPADRRLSLHDRRRVHGLGRLLRSR